jgi:ABC-type multidrug transport system ATPase subunit
MTMPDDTNRAPALAVQGISKRYGSVWANRDVSLTVPAGDILGLLGPNGAGKTTLIRICAGLIAADAGTVLVGGRRVERGDATQRTRLGLVSRDVPLQEELRVDEALRVQAALYGMFGTANAARCAEVIAQFHLRDFAQQRISRLSSGMRQRTALAAAVLHRPTVLLLDEPTLGLDPEARQTLWDCLRQLVAGGTAILLTTHYLEEAHGLCSAVVVMVNGAPAYTARAQASATPPDLSAAYLAALQSQQEPAR